MQAAYDSKDDTIPGNVLASAHSDRSDVKAEGTHSTEMGEWTVILSRSQINNTPDQDEAYILGT